MKLEKFKTLKVDDKIVLFDPEDAEDILKYKWCIQKSTRNKFYAKRTGKNNKHISMHRQILGLVGSKKPSIDHVNGNGLDNRKENLRICTQSQNLYNAKKRKGTTSKYKGVSYKKECRVWIAYGSFEGRMVHLGRFKKEIDAAKAYDDYAIKNYGEFAKLNIPCKVVKKKRPKICYRCLNIDNEIQDLRTQNQMLNEKVEEIGRECDLMTTAFESAKAENQRLEGELKFLKRELEKYEDK